MWLQDLVWGLSVLGCFQAMLDQSLLIALIRFHGSSWLKVDCAGTVQQAAEGFLEGSFLFCLQKSLTDDIINLSVACMQVLCVYYQPLKLKILHGESLCI